MKVIMTENQINNLLNKINQSVKLPKFIYNAIKNGKTYLGKNDAFPPEEDYPFEYKIIKGSHKQVLDNLNSLHLEQNDENYLSTYLSKLLKKCIELEKPIRDGLEKLCYNTVISLFNIPEETINISCKLTDKVEPSNGYRVYPELSDKRNFAFNDMTDMNNAGKVILKRRLINSLIQGVSHKYGSNIDFFIKDVYKLNKELIPLYEEIITINDYLVFVQNNNITDENPKQGAYVEVKLGKENIKSEISSQGIIFPFLLTETIRGLFELFASHGLPKDKTKAMYVIKQSDFLCAEPWDFRFGISLWEYIDEHINDERILPYVFTKICEENVDEFNIMFKEIFAKTKKGSDILNDIINESQSEFDENSFSNQMKLKNAEHNLLNDGYFTADELDSLVIENDDEYQIGVEDDGALGYSHVIGEDDEKSNKNVLEITKANPLDITFEVGSAMPSWYQGKRQIYQLYPVYNNIEYSPEDGINLLAEEVIVNGKQYYQLHINVREDLRQNGLAFKLYQSFIMQGYPTCSLYKNRTATFNSENNVKSVNDDTIVNLWNKLANSGVNVEPLMNRNGDEIGVYATMENDTMNENVDVETQLYHGSYHNFDKFDLAYMGNGYGEQYFGYGVYLTFNKEMAAAYGQGQVYTVEIDSDDSKYLHQDGYVEQDIIDKVKEYCFNKKIDEYIEDYCDEAEYTLETELSEWFPNEISGKHLFYTLSRFVNDEKECSELLYSLGIIGYKYIDGQSENVLMFNADDIEIIDKEENIDYLN